MLTPPLIINTQDNGSDVGVDQWDPYIIYMYDASFSTYYLRIPYVVSDFKRNYYRISGGEGTAPGTELAETNCHNMWAYVSTAPKTMVDYDGIRKWQPHNLITNSESFANQSFSCFNNETYTFEVVGSGHIIVTDGVQTSDPIIENFPYEITTQGTTLTITHSASVPSKVWAYRSDLGGMVLNPDTNSTYVASYSDYEIKPRLNHHEWNTDGYWENKGLLLESDGARNWINDSTNGTLNETISLVSGETYTLSFEGGGTVTLSGANTATLDGSGLTTGERYKHTFYAAPEGVDPPGSPTDLVCTSSGTITYPQLENGIIATSFFPTYGTTRLRVDDAISLRNTYDDASLWITFGSSDLTGFIVQMKGEINWANTGVELGNDGRTAEVNFFTYRVNNQNYVFMFLNSTLGENSLKLQWEESGSITKIQTANNFIQPGYSVPFNLAFATSRNGNFTWFSANTEASGAGQTWPAGASFGVEIGRTFNGTIELFRVWNTSLHLFGDEYSEYGVRVSATNNNYITFLTTNDES